MGLFSIFLVGSENRVELWRGKSLRLLARQVVDEIRELLTQIPQADEAIARALAAYDLLSSVAREPRKVRQSRLGNSLWSAKQ